jgi:3-hydroxyacyl-CoA dehydrogenase/enoyl-CoA hydratase/3-hydroxybutyryl-CoA epimerase
VTPAPTNLREFRLEFKDNGLVHIVFDAPGRSMNVFTEAATLDIGVIAGWLAEAEVRGALIRSGKESGFCAGANLPEIWAAYDNVMATPKHRRFASAYDHFFRLSHPLRALETCGKPLAAAVVGLALGGGDELALAAHHRVLTDDRRAKIGLPESLVGLLPGAGGTQRCRGWSEWKNHSDTSRRQPARGRSRAGRGARARGGRAGRRNRRGRGVVTVRAAGPPTLGSRRLDSAVADRGERGGCGFSATRSGEIARTLSGRVRDSRLCRVWSPAEFRGRDPERDDEFHPSDPASRATRDNSDVVSAPARLQRLERKQQSPEVVAKAVAATRATIEASRPDYGALSAAGFAGLDDVPTPVRNRSRPGYWVESDDPRAAPALAALERIGDAVAPLAAGRSEEELRVADYAVVRQAGYPGYLGGPFSFESARGADTRMG